MRQMYLIVVDAHSHMYLIVVDAHSKWLEVTHMTTTGTEHTIIVL